MILYIAASKHGQNTPNTVMDTTNHYLCPHFYYSSSSSSFYWYFVVCLCALDTFSSCLFGLFKDIRLLYSLYYILVLELNWNEFPSLSLSHTKWKQILYLYWDCVRVPYIILSTDNFLVPEIWQKRHQKKKNINPTENLFLLNMSPYLRLFMHNTKCGHLSQLFCFPLSSIVPLLF